MTLWGGNRLLSAHDERSQRRSQHIAGDVGHGWKAIVAEYLESFQQEGQQEGDEDSRLQ